MHKIYKNTIVEANTTIYGKKSDYKLPIGRQHRNRPCRINAVRLRAAAPRIILSEYQLLHDVRHGCPALQHHTHPKVSYVLPPSALSLLIIFFSKKICYCMWPYY
ncbi:hypothetical protein DSUL_20405 [Desulfovibrionales bacterium]